MRDYDRRGFHAKHGGGAEDFSAGLRKSDCQILTLPLLEFGACQDSGSLRQFGAVLRRDSRLVGRECMDRLGKAIGFEATVGSEKRSFFGILRRPQVSSRNRLLAVRNTRFEKQVRFI
jgi:hypothetical protein